MLPNKVIIIGRHGARAPILHLSGLPEYDWGVDIGDFQKMLSGAPLTNKGRTQTEELGKKAKNNYNDMIDDHTKITIYSSNVERTIETAKIFTKHFVNSDKIKIVVDNRLAGDIHFPQNKKDQFFDARKKVRVQNDTDELRKEIKDKLKFDVTESFNYFEISSTLKCYEAEGISDSLNDDTWSCIHENSEKYYYELFSDACTLELMTKGILELLEEIKNEDDKFVYISTHDVILYPLARLIFNEKVKMPEFNEQMVLKVYDDYMECHYGNKVAKV
jgi:hypothetical protein